MKKKCLMLEDWEGRTLQVIAGYMHPDLAPMYLQEEWVIVRSYQEFVDWILANGLPDIISFDHDLADEHYDMSKTCHHYKEKTGYDAAKWLVEFCIHEFLPLPECYVHSMNPIGADNIEKYLTSYRKMYEKEDKNIREQIEENIKKSTITLSKIDDKDKWLKDLRGE